LQIQWNYKKYINIYVYIYIYCDRTAECLRRGGGGGVTSVEWKLDNISKVQSTEYNRDTAEGHVSVEEVTGVEGVTVKFQRSYEGSYIIQTLVNSASFELQDGKGKFRGLFNLKHQKPYLENRID
jgi:hypothetical protein